MAMDAGNTLTTMRAIGRPDHGRQTTHTPLWADPAKQLLFRVIHVEALESAIKSRRT
jgi:hypothetical protein